MGWDSLRCGLLLVVVGSAAGACANVWGFEPGKAEGDGSAATPDATSTFDALADAIASAENAADADGGLGGGSEDGQAGGCPGLCVPPAPSGGWEGPFEVLESLDGGPEVPCDPTSWVQAYDLSAAPDAAPASCACGCDPPTGVGCSLPVAAFYSNEQCSEECFGAPTASVGETCSSLPDLGPACGPTAYVQVTSHSDGGSCLPTAAMDAAAVAWGATASVCAPASSTGACEAGVCLPLDDGGNPAYCIVHQGAYGCPDPYSVLHEYGDGGSPYYSDASDQRSCACSCGGPSGACSSVALFSDSACGALVSAADASPPPCLSLSRVISAIAQEPPSPGSCASYGGPTGGVALASPVTVCCTR